MDTTRIIIGVLLISLVIVVGLLLLKIKKAIGAVPMKELDDEANKDSSES